MANKEDTKKRSNRLVLTILVILLLLFNAFLLVKLVQKKPLENELIETKNLKAKLELEVDSIQNIVTNLEGTIYEKDTSLVSLQNELQAKVKEIEVLIANERITESKYRKALDEIKKLEYYTKKYQEQINELKAKNKQLTQENEGLKEEVKTVKKEVDQLTDENVSLSNKVSLGAMLKTNSISAIGIQKRNNGKIKETLKGSRMEALKISFTIKDNILAQAGSREFYIKVLNPKGETLYLEERGSGQFDYQGEQSLYTVKSEFEFNNDPEFVYSVLWDRGSEFEKGIYEIRIINNGVMMGKTTFEVK